MNLIRYTPLEETGEKIDIHNELDQKISATQKELEEILSIIQQYTTQWKEYQEIFQEKTGKLQELYRKYTAYLFGTQDAKEQKEYEEAYKDFADFSNAMGFENGESGHFGGYSSYEKYYDHYKQQEKKRKDENYKKVDMQEVQGDLADALGGLTYKEIWRKISVLLHPDKLENNVTAKGKGDYLEFLKDLYTSLGESYEKEDTGAMIVAIQSAGIRFIDGKFALPSYEQFQKGAMKIHKQKILDELMQSIKIAKSTNIYSFYVAYKSGDTQSKLQEIDDEIQEIEDLLASYQQTEESDAK